MEIGTERSVIIVDRIGVGCTCFPEQYHGNNEHLRLALNNVMPIYVSGNSVEVLVEFGEEHPGPSDVAEIAKYVINAFHPRHQFYLDDYDVKYICGRIYIIIDNGWLMERDS